MVGTHGLYHPHPAPASLGLGLGKETPGLRHPLGAGTVNLQFGPSEPSVGERGVGREGFRLGLSDSHRFQCVVGRLQVVDSPPPEIEGSILPDSPDPSGAPESIPTLDPHPSPPGLGPTGYWYSVGEEDHGGAGRSRSPTPTKTQVTDGGSEPWVRSPCSLQTLLLGHSYCRHTPRHGCTVREKNGSK